ncbi:MAG: hypothetical protein IPG89_00710 [Bacteroidetes bacterium]|nr:hypothetical protein [Bacteroidota bacterium]
MEENKKLGELIIFPNPSNGDFVIKAVKNTSIIISDELGRIASIIEPVFFHHEILPYFNINLP